MSTPRLFRVAVEVDGLDAAVAFYDRLLGVAGKRVGGGRAYYDAGGPILALVDVASGGETPKDLPQDLYFAVDDLEAVHARAKELGALSGADVHGEDGGAIVTRPWGERSFYAVDPFGNGLCFADAATLFAGAR